MTNPQGLPAAPSATATIETGRPTHASEAPAAGRGVPLTFSTDPYAEYRALRAAGPVHWDAAFCGGAWVLTDYADVAAVLQDPRFSVQRVGRWVNSSGPEARTRLRGFKRILSRSVLFLNAGRHERVRRALHAGFKPAMLQAAAPRIQRVVDRLLDDLVSAGAAADVDFIQAFARPLPALVVAELLGIDPAARPDFVRWSDDIAAFIGAPTPSMAQAEQAQSSLLALYGYFDRLLPQRRLQPGQDWFGTLVTAQAEGMLTTTTELLAQCCTLLFAGHETTRNLLGNGLFHLLHHPAQWRALADAPAHMHHALRELLRFDSPVQYSGRIVTADVTLHGQRLRKGDLVIPLIGAANRDPARFTDPDRLDLARREANHLSFGSGAHVCIGAALTYLEAGIAFETLLRRLPGLRFGAAPAVWGHNAVYRGLSHLPVRTTV